MPSRPSARVSVIVVTRNRRRRLLRSIPHQLESLDPGSRTHAGLVVVDDASSDGTAAAVVEAHPDVAVVRTDHNIGVAGRGVGAAMAPTRYVAFSDDDSWWTPGALEAAADVLDTDPTVGLVIGRVLVGPGRRVDPIDRALRSAEPVGFLACAAVVRRHRFLAAGGFPTVLGVGSEEALLAADLLSAGVRLVYRPECTVVHEPEPGPERADRRMRHATNALLVAIARRRLGYLPAAVGRQLAAVGLIHAPAMMSRTLARLRWALVHRRPVSPVIERRLRAAERSAQVEASGTRHHG